MPVSIVFLVHLVLISQIPVLWLLMAPGYQYLRRSQAVALRHNSQREVVPAMASFVTGELSDE